MTETSWKRTALALAAVVCCLAGPSFGSEEAAKASELPSEGGLLVLPHVTMYEGPALAAPAIPAAAEGMRVSIDPRTGALRTPTVREVRELNRQARELAAGQIQSKSAPVEIRRADGTIGRAVDPDLLSYSVVQVTADGSMVSACIDGRDEAFFHQHEATAPAPEEK